MVCSFRRTTAAPRPATLKDPKASLTENSDYTTGSSVDNSSGSADEVLNADNASRRRRGDLSRARKRGVITDTAAGDRPENDQIGNAAPSGIWRTSLSCCAVSLAERRSSILLGRDAADVKEERRSTIRTMLRPSEAIAASGGSGRCFRHDVEFFVGSGPRQVCLISFLERIMHLASTQDQP